MHQKVGYTPNLNMSALDKLVSQDDDDEFDSSDDDSDSNSEDEEGSGEDESDSDSSLSSGEVEKEINPVDDEGRLRYQSTPEEWAAVVEEYRRTPTTELER